MHNIKITSLLMKQAHKIKAEIPSPISSILPKPGKQLSSMTGNQTMSTMQATAREKRWNKTKMLTEQSSLVQQRRHQSYDEAAPFHSKQANKRERQLKANLKINVNGKKKKSKCSQSSSKNFMTSIDYSKKPMGAQNGGAFLSQSRNEDIYGG